ncbi:MULTISPECIES: hypothetical protein [Photorhabdus]|uniref:InsA N-terminal domain-containing protein n=1 Tax=Photorhabdus bodei TaxID=2029681 RepID=A0AAW6BSI3_9GAMM|nr:MULTISPECIES: hypothetical protein [Photorhabdus]MDB6374959.1 hypothetical protein [Photorhabdus bodei]
MKNQSIFTGLTICLTSRMRTVGISMLILTQHHFSAHFFVCPVCGVDSLHNQESTLL